MAAPVAPSGGCGQLTKPTEPRPTQNDGTGAFQEGFYPSHKLVMMCLELGVRKVGNSIKSGNCCIAFIRAKRFMIYAANAADRMPRYKE